MKKYSKETAVGFFVLVGLIGIAYMSIKLGNVQLFSSDFYMLHAEFTDVSGLKVNAPVEMYGVGVGFVESISLDQDNGMAAVVMRIQNGVRVLDDAIVSVKTSGLIGDKYLKISPGGGGDELHDGDLIFDTEPAIDLEDLISKFAFGDV